MRRRMFVFLGVLAFITCSLVALFFDGYYLPFKPCRPITYPDGKTVSEKFSFTTTDSLETVLSFYDQHLNVQPWPGDRGQWRSEELKKYEYLYSCYVGDINGLTTETGCIHISSGKESTHIEALLFRSEGGNIPCSRG